MCNSEKAKNVTKRCMTVAFACDCILIREYANAARRHTSQYFVFLRPERWSRHKSPPDQKTPPGEIMNRSVYVCHGSAGDR